ncbi:MAG: FAD:protein FMN transferase [Planctomycetota bacterium]
MGTTFRIVLYDTDRAAAEAAARAAFEEISDIEAALTDWDPGSELSLLSRISDDSAPTPWVPVSPLLGQVLAEARAIAERTDGAFDPTMGPAIRLWRRSRRQGELPSHERIAEAKAASGWQQLEVGEGSRHVRLHSAHMRLDLGGIAKGTALDRALFVLTARGIESALVDGGGDIAVSGPPPDRRGWRVIVRPFEAEDAPVELTLANAAVATSGDRYRFVEIEGVRYSHLIDPSTGLGLRQRRAATVIGRSGARADAFATALCIAGPAGLGFIEAESDLEARLWVFENDERRTCDSSGVSRFIEAEPEPDPPAPADESSG